MLDDFLIEENDQFWSFIGLKKPLDCRWISEGFCFLRSTLTRHKQFWIAEKVPVGSAT